MNLGINFTHVGLAGPNPEQYDELPYATRVIRNLCTVMAGVQPKDIPVELETQSKSRWFFFSCQGANNQANSI